MEISHTVSSAIRYLEHLAQLGPLTLKQIAEGIGESNATGARRLRTLEQHGFVRQLSDQTWTLGPSLLHLTSHVPDPLIAFTAGPIRRLAERVSGTIVLARCVSPFFEIVVEQEGRGSSPRIEDLTGVRIEIWRAAPGLAFLASLSEEEREEIRDRAEEPQVVDDALRQLALRGRVVLPSRIVKDRVGIAAPIVTEHPPATWGSLTVSVPDESEEHTAVITDMLMDAVGEAATRISASHARTTDVTSPQQTGSQTR